MNDETMLEAFEKWASSNGYDLSEGYYNPFGHFTTQHAWDVWQAAINTRAQASAPDGDEWKCKPYRDVSQIIQHMDSVWANGSSADWRMIGDWVHEFRRLRHDQDTRSNAKAGDVDDATLDRMCQAFYENKGSMKWDKLLDCWKDNYRSNMRAALSTHDKTKA